MKSVTILQHNGGRLANQLWSYASIYAYCLEKGYTCYNPSFFLYVDLFEGLELTGFSRVYKIIPNRKVFTFLYKIIAKIQVWKNKTIIADEEFLLPPSLNENENQISILQDAEKSSGLYFSGWLFRNPIGLAKYHKEILKYFAPKKKFTAVSEEIIKFVKDKYTYSIGVHIRQGDYRYWQDGKFYVSPEKAAIRMKSIIEQNDKYTLNNTCFIICSDENIDQNVFSGLNVVFGPNTTIGDLYILSLTDQILGSNSTFGLWASYLGQINFTSF